MVALVGFVVALLLLRLIVDRQRRRGADLRLLMIEGDER